MLAVIESKLSVEWRPEQGSGGLLVNLNKEECMVGGDSPMRDLGGANAAGIDCVLAGGAMGKQSVDSFPA